LKHLIALFCLHRTSYFFPNSLHLARFTFTITVIYFFLLFFTFFLSSLASSSLSYCGDVGEYDGEVGE